MIGKVVVITGVCFLVLKIWHPMPFNTEQVCFNSDGEIIVTDYVGDISLNGKTNKITLSVSTGTFKEDIRRSAQAGLFKPLTLVK